MKYGCINAPCLDPNKKSLFWLQTRSSWESALKAHAIELINSTSGKDWLETCGSHSAVNCLTAVNPDPSTLESHGPGGDTPRVPDVLTATVDNVFHFLPMEMHWRDLAVFHDHDFLGVQLALQRLPILDIAVADRE